MNYRARNCIVFPRDMGNKDLACPKPHRVFGNGFRGGCETGFCSMKLGSHGFLQGEAEPGHEILEILFQKVCLGDVGSPSNTMIPHLYESPPTRASNPLIHDVQFNIHKKKVMPSPLFPKNFVHNSSNNSSCKKSSCGTSYGSKQPFVRIEGFCSSTSKAH